MLNRSHQVQGIVVSNHGGRQVDGGVSSLGTLPVIVDAVGDQLDIFFDSGIRAGADIAKAMALGAKMCLIGRPYGEFLRSNQLGLRAV